MLCFTANRLFIPNGLMLFSLELYNWHSEDFNLEGGQYPIRTIIFPAFISSCKFFEEFCTLQESGLLFTTLIFPSC